MKKVPTSKSCYCHCVFLWVRIIDWDLSLYASCLVLDQCHDFQDGWINSLVKQFVFISDTFILCRIIRLPWPRKYIITHWKCKSENLKLIIRFYFNSLSIVSILNSSLSRKIGHSWRIKCFEEFSQTKSMNNAICNKCKVIHHQREDVCKRTLEASRRLVRRFCWLARFQGKEREGGSTVIFYQC